MALLDGALAAPFLLSSCLCLCRARRFRPCVSPQRPLSRNAVWRLAREPRTRGIGVGCCVCARCPPPPHAEPPRFCGICNEASKSAQNTPGLRYIPRFCSAVRAGPWAVGFYVSFAGISVLDLRKSTADLRKFTTDLRKSTADLREFTADLRVHVRSPRASGLLRGMRVGRAVRYDRAAAPHMRVGPRGRALSRVQRPPQWRAARAGGADVTPTHEHGPGPFDFFSRDPRHIARLN